MKRGGYIPVKKGARTARKATRARAARVAPTSEETLADPTGAALLRRLLQETVQDGGHLLLFRVREGESRVEDSFGRILFAGGKTWHPIFLDRLRLLGGLPNRPNGNAVLERGRFSFSAVAGKETSLFRLSIVKGVEGEEAQVKLLRREGRARDIDELGFSAHQCLQAREALAKPGLIWVTAPGEEGLTSTLFALLRELPGKGRTFTIEEEVHYRTPEFLQLETLGLGASERTEVLKELKYLEFSRIMVDRVSPAQLGDLLALALRKRWVLAGCAQASMEESLLSLVAHCTDVPLYGLSLVVHQRLVPLLCSACKTASPLSTGEMRTLERLLPGPWRFFQEGEGCDQCGGKATSGAKAFFEVIPVDASMRESLYAEARGERRIPTLLGRVKPSIGARVAEFVARGEVSVSEIWDLIWGQPAVADVRLCRRA